MRKLVLATFIFVAYLIFRPILGDVWYPVHDTTSIARTYLMEKTLAYGQIPAIWAGELNYGGGYPLFHFYAPAVSYLSLLGKTITGSYFIGVKLVLILSSLSGMIGMYLLTRKWGRAAGIVSALSYAFLPYAAVNLYVRGAYGEYLSMALLPWLFYIWQDLTSSRKQIIASLLTSLFLLSHNLIPLITAPFLLVWILLTKPKLDRLILPILLTLGLSAFYLFPLLFERGFVQADRVAKTTDYAKHFVAPVQLWNSLWGYGGSGEGIEDGMSFKVGKIQLILAGIATLTILIKRKKNILFFVVSALLAVFMTTSYSSFIWQSLGFLRIVQFPWRFLVLVGFFIAILAGYSLTLISNIFLRNIFMLLAVGGLLFVNLKLFSPQSTFPADLSMYTIESYLNTLPKIIPEYQPKWMPQLAEFRVSDISISDHPPFDQESTGHRIESTPYTFSMVINTPNGSDASIARAYYPTWILRIDNVETKFEPGTNGNMDFTIPPGEHIISLKQSHTLLEKISSLISLITFLTLLLYYFYPKIYVKN